MGSAGLRALVVLSDASCVGRESLHACCEFAGIDALLVKRKCELPALLNQSMRPAPTHLSAARVRLRWIFGPVL